MAYSDEVLADSPWAFWPLTDGSGTSLEDLGPSGYDGTLGASPGTPTWLAESPVAGTAASLRFDGSNDRASLTQLGTFGTEPAGSIEFWFRSSDLSGIAAILGLVNSGTNLLVSIETNSDGGDGTRAGALAFAYRRTGASIAGNVTRWRTPSSLSLIDGAWHHIAFTYDLTTPDLDLWADGEPVALVTENTSTSGNFSASYGFPLMLGARNVRGTADRFFDGDVSHLAVYDHRLSEARIAAHYAAAVGWTWEPPPLDLELDLGPADLTFDQLVANPAPVDLALTVAPATFTTGLRFDVAPVDLALTVGAAVIGQTVWPAEPADVTLELGVATWEQAIWEVPPADLDLDLGTVTMQWPIILEVPDVLHRTGEVKGLLTPPVVTPGRAVPIDVEIRRGATGELLGRSRTAQVNRCTWTHNGVGEATLTWVPRRSDEPEVVDHLIADGEPLTWRDNDLEVWIYRAGRLVWCGPVVWQAHSPQTGRLDLRAWSREGYVKRLTYGDTERTNVFPAGEFSPGLPGWSSSQATLTATTSPIYRRPYSMRITPTGGGNRARAWARFQEGPEPRLNVLYVGVTAMFESGSGWAPDPNSRNPLLGQIVRTLLHPVTGAPIRPPDTATLTVDATESYGPGQWLRAIRPIRRVPGYLNDYRVDLYATDGPVVVGEVEAVYEQNIGAYAGDGRRYSSWVAALAQTTTRYLAGTDWTYDVGPAGPVLVSNKATNNHDHPQFWSLWEDASLYGDWWCPVQPERMIRYRERRGSYRPELRIVGQQAASRLTAEWDGAAETVANEMIALADGMDGPTREAGSYSTPASGARLMRCEMAPPGTLPRDLDLYAEQVVTSEGSPARRITATNSAGPAAGDDPTRRTLPGAFIHIIEPGDWTTIRQVDGELDYVMEPYVQTMTWDARADTVDFAWEGS